MADTTKRADVEPILTDGEGRPIPHPGKPPPQSAGLDAWLVWLRARWAYEDHVTDVANRAFSRASTNNR